MVILGVDVHKRSHTVVAVDDLGRRLGTRTTTHTTSHENMELVRWAARFGIERTWAVEDCRNLSRRLEADLLAAGERIIRVPTRLMASCRKGFPGAGKSDPIDAWAVARAALLEPRLPQAVLDGPERELRLLLDHREQLVRERTRLTHRVRWHLHELDPEWDPPSGSLARPRWWTEAASRLGASDGLVGRIGCDLVGRIADINDAVEELDLELQERVELVAPTLLGVHGVGVLGASKLMAEVADVRRFHSRDAFAKYAGTAAGPRWSARPARDRYIKSGNRQVNLAIHRMAAAQLRREGSARAFMERKLSEGKTRAVAFRALKRRLSNVVFQAMKADASIDGTAATRRQPQRRFSPANGTATAGSALRRAPVFEANLPER